MPNERLSPRDVAILLIELVRATERRREKDLSRVRIRISTLRLLADRLLIRTVFLDELHGELADLGWIWFVIDHATFGMIEQRSALGWTRAGVKGVFEEILEEVADGKFEFDEKWDELREGLVEDADT